MPDDCLFCRIVRGDLAAHKVFEDGAAFAFLDIKPLTRGHALVIPKTHYARLEDMPPEEAGRLMHAVHAVSGSACKAVGATGATIAINNGKAAGQEVDHVHVHVVPRRDGDGFGPIHALFRGRPAPAPEDLSALAARMRGGEVGGGD